MRACVALPCTEVLVEPLTPAPTVPLLVWELAEVLLPVLATSLALVLVLPAELAMAPLVEGELATVLLVPCVPVELAVTLQLNCRAILVL